MIAALIFATLLVAHVDAMSARAAPRSGGLAKIERQIAHSKSNSIEGPIAAQTVGAELHQPTSAAVKSAKRKAPADYQMALVRPGDANGGGGAAACARALNAARELYGVQ
jgi:hypothetical protein